MKTTRNSFSCRSADIRFWLNQFASPERFRGLWNFDEADLTATAGEDLEYMDEDTMADLVEFGTTEALGLPPSTTRLPTS